MNVHHENLNLSCLRSRYSVALRIYLPQRMSCAVMLAVGAIDIFNQPSVHFCRLAYLLVDDFLGVLTRSSSLLSLTTHRATARKNSLSASPVGARRKKSKKKGSIGNARGNRKIERFRNGYFFCQGCERAG